MNPPPNPGSRRNDSRHFDINRQILTPAMYDGLEIEAVSKMSVPIIQAFQPVTYLQFGFPVRVTVECELMRYVDHNFEAEVPQIFAPGAHFPASGFVNSFTPDENKLLEIVRDRVAFMTARLFGQTIRPVTTLIVQVAPFRVIAEIARATATPAVTVFEAGPGLGYFGALLSLQGHRHISFDVTQAMYLWQNRLLGEMAGEQFCESALGPQTNSLSDKRVVHVPWWHYVDYLERCPLKTVDIVYSNSNLCEMSPVALRMLLQVGKKMLSASDISLFCFFGTGFPGQTPVDKLPEEFLRQGYTKIEGLPFEAYSPNRRNNSTILQAFAKGIPLYNPSGDQTRLTASQVVAVKRNEAPLDMAATAWYYGWNPPYID